MELGKSKGGLESIAPAFIAVLLTAILLFSVLLPVTNTNLAGNGTCQPGATCAWNQSGYTGALQVAQQVPLLFVLVFFVSIAAVVISQMKF